MKHTSKQQFIALIQKELSFYFNTPVGYIAGALFASFVNFIFIKDLFIRGNSSLRPMFESLPWFLVVFIPAIAMRVFAEEYKTRTSEILFTLPISEKTIVLAKTAAVYIFFCSALILTLSVPVTVSILGHIALVETAVSYVGVLFLAGSFISLGVLISSVTQNQIVAFLISTVAIFISLMLGGDFFASVIPQIIREYLSVFAPLHHYDAFLKGTIELKALIYFVSIIVICTYFSICNLKKRS